MRRATGNKKVDRHHISDAVVLLGLVTKDPAADSTGADCNDKFRGGNGCKGAESCGLHVSGYRTGDQNAVSVPWRSHDFDSESAQIKYNGSKNVDIYLTAVAATGTDLSELNRPAEHFAFYCIGKLDFRAVHDKIGSFVHCQTMVVRKSDGPLRADFGAGTAENAPAEVYLQIFSGQNGCSWADFSAKPAIPTTFFPGYDRPAAKTVG